MIVWQVPADLVLLRTTEKSGASFIRTDQLDGETDWKLRCLSIYLSISLFVCLCMYLLVLENERFGWMIHRQCTIVLKRLLPSSCPYRKAVPYCQKLPSDQALLEIGVSLYGIVCHPPLLACFFILVAFSHLQQLMHARI